MLTYIFLITFNYKYFGIYYQLTLYKNIHFIIDLPLFNQARIKEEEK